jgi:hypothetical protein
VEVIVSCPPTLDVSNLFVVFPDSPERKVCSFVKIDSVRAIAVPCFPSDGNTTLYFSLFHEKERWNHKAIADGYKSVKRCSLFPQCDKQMAI